MNGEDLIKLLKTLEYWDPKGVGIWSVDFFGIDDIVRLQFSRNHVEYLRLNEVVPRVVEHFETMSILRETKIEDLSELSGKYVHIYTGTMGDSRQESFVRLADVIDILNHRRKELSFLDNGAAMLKKLLS